jgi:PAS domain S-box-containing protein
MGAWRPQRGQNVYDGLRGQIASAIQGSRFFQAHRQAETALRHEKDLSDTIIASLPGIFYMYDDQGRLVRWNKKYEEITGYSTEELLRTHFAHFYAPEDADQFMVQMRKAFSDGSAEFEVALMTRDGEKIPYYFTGVRAQIEDQIYLVGMGIDITERTRAEQDLQEYQEHLEELVEKRTAELRAINEQLIILSSVKDTFVTNVSHELRTPIASLKLYAYLMDRRPEKREIYIASLKRETSRLEKLIEGVLLLSRLDQRRVNVNPELFDLNDLAHEYLIDRTPLAESNQLTLMLDPTPDLPRAKADRQLLGEILSILLTNAFSYTPAGEKVIISTVTAGDGDEQWLGFSVTDSGPGILPDEQKHMFERFYRGKAARDSGTPGTGLGLAIAKEIVELHHGRIEVHSDGKPGHGAKFSVWLPANPDD